MASRSLPRVLVLLLAIPLTTLAQSPELSKTGQEFVRVQAPRIVLAHVRVIDGTGGPAAEDQNVVIEGARITAIGAGGTSVRSRGCL